MATSFRSEQNLRTHDRNALSDHAKCWKHNEETGFLDPAWPRDPPDVDVVFVVAEQYLPTDFRADTMKTWTAQGAFHKLYCFYSQTKSTSYLMRVAIPVERFYKTESEVATMHYLQRNTSIPIPKVVAWSSNAERTALGFEWILMENVEAVTLRSVWGKMDFAAKMSLTKHIASKLQELLDLRFTLLGNIYFADKWNEVGYPSLSSIQLLPESPSTSSKTNIDIGKDGNFVIGRMVSTRFFRDKSALLRVDRGPYEQAKELAVADTKLLGQRIRHLSYKPGSDYYCEVDHELYKDKTEMLDVFNALEQFSTDIFSNSDQPEDRKVLWHNDLSDVNILVHPETFVLEAIVDWESVSIVPAWEINNGIPSFLLGNEVDEPPPLGTLSDEDEDGLVEIRKDWELSLLRKAYTDIIGPLFKPSQGLENRIQLKTGFRVCLVTFEDVWKRTRSWLNRTKAEDGFELV